MTSPKDPAKFTGPVNTDRAGNNLNWFVTTPFVRFNPLTGEILEAGEMSFAGINHLEQAGAGRYLKERGHFDTHFVDVESLAVVEKAPCPASLDGVVLRNLPRPCRIEISNPVGAPTVYEENAKSVELAFDHAGSYQVRVLSVPHLPGEFEVVVA